MPALFRCNAKKQRNGTFSYFWTVWRPVAARDVIFLEN